MILFSDVLALNQLFIAVVLKMLLLSSGCVESNPGPDNKITFGVWNLDSLLTRDKHKIGLIEGINSVKKFDIFGVVESYLTPDIKRSIFKTTAMKSWFKAKTSEKSIIILHKVLKFLE
jgi:hypothetical protein